MLSKNVTKIFEDNQLKKQIAKKMIKARIFFLNYYINFIKVTQ